MFNCENKFINYWGVCLKWVFCVSDMVKFMFIGDYNENWDNFGFGYKNDLDFLVCVFLG